MKAAPDYSGAKGSIKDNDELIPIDYDGLMVKVEEASRIVPENTTSNIIEVFRAKTNEMFHDISEMNPAEIEETIKCHVQAKIDEYDIDATIIDAVVVGSRCRGLEKDSSDLDVVVELSTNEREDDLFNAFNEDGLHIGDVRVDINPITVQRTGTLETYLPQAEEHLESIRQEREQELAQQMQTQGEMEKEEVEVTLMVSECGEFHNLPDEIQRAKVLLEKLAEYKPLAKIEEMEEQNYNMIDNVLNNGAEKAQREANKKDQEQPAVKASLKARLAEKRAQVSSHGQENEVQENKKNNQREM